ncbi:MAG: dockerin type I domain-containing protein [Phycisphaerales bacterium]
MNRLCKAFLLAGLAGSSTPALGVVNFFDIFYLTYYDQPSASAPTEYSSNSFTARIIAEPGSVGTAEFASPLELSINLPEIGPGYFLAQWSFGDPDSMVAAFPSGNYIFGISEGSMGSSLGEIARAENTYWSDEIPAFTGECFQAMQNVDSSIDFGASFNTFSAPAPANLGVTFLSILDSSNSVVFNEFFPSSDGARTIPAGTLLPGRAYRAVLFFSSRVELQTADLGGSTSIAAFDRVTTAPLFTLPTCVGDLNNDGLVDDSDFVIFVGAYNLLDCADPSMAPGCPADLNRDGFVDDSDFVLFVGAYNELICP